MNRQQSTPKSAKAQRRQKPQILSQSLSRFGSAAAITAALLASAAVQSPATTYYWDTDGTDVGNSTAGAGLGGTSTWDLATSNWWDTTNPLTLWTNTNADVAIFSGVAGALPTANTVTLSAGIIANRASFIRSGYLLTGGDLTLDGSGAGLHANLAESATIASQILGTAGLTKTGGGSIRLGNAANSYTGTTTISNGSLVISAASALGADASAVVVTGFNNNPGNATNLRGMGGGSLVLDGLTSPITFTRDLSLQGQGPIADRGGALISIGDNTLSGAVAAANLAFGVTPINTTIISAHGTLGITNSLSVQATGVALATTTTVGGTNQGGISNYNLTGSLSGVGILSKQGSGALFLSPSSSAGFSGSIRTNGSNAVGQSGIRIQSAGVLGTRTATGTTSVLDLNGGFLEVLMDSPVVNAGGTAAAHVYGRAGTTIFVDQGLAGTATNQTVNFGQFAFEENQTFNFNSRNGYSMSFGVAPVQGGNNNSTFNNNLQGGLLTFAGNFWSNTDNGANRTLTFTSTGDTLIDGNIVASAAGFNHVFTKAGTGTLTVTGAASTLDGNFNINQGTVATRRIQGGILGTGTAAGLLQIGNAGNTGTLNYLGAVTTGAGETLTRTIRLDGTTGGARINANQAGGAPTALIINGPVQFNDTVSAKTLTLGGTSASSIENRINTGLNPGTNTVSLTKTDSNTWVLGGTNTYTGTTTISGGTLRLAATAGASTVLSDVSPLAFNVDATTQAAGGRLLFSGVTGVATTETVSTVNPAAGHGTVRVENGGALTTLNLGALNATSGSSAVSINFEAPAANDVITLPGAANSFVQGNAYFNGANFAYRNATNGLRAPVYGVDAGFVTSAVALTGGSHNELTGNIGPITNTTISSLKISGSRTITITGNNTLGINTGTRTVGGIIVTGGAATITGGSVGTFTGNGGALAIRTDALTDSLTLASSINANVSVGLVKSGLGTLILSGSNNQVGVQINEGTIQLSGTGRLGGTNSNLVIRQNSTLDLNGVTQPTTTVAAFNGAGRVTNSAAAAVGFTVGGNGQGGTFSGSIDEVNGQLNLTKVGTGTLALTGSSNYTGDTIIGGGSTGGINASTLANIGSASSIGAGDGTSDTTNRESLVLNGNSGVSAATGIATPGFLQYVGTANATTNRLFSLGAVGAGAGGRIIASGVNNVGVVFSGTGGIGYVGNAGTAAQTLVLSGGSTADNRIDLELDNSSTGGGNLAINKQDGGKWVLTNAGNDYSGGTKINGGILETVGTSLSTSSALLFGGTLAIPTGGVLETSGTFNRALDAGTVANTVNFNANGNFAGSGGFSASGSKLTVNLGGASAPLTWSGGGFLMSGSAAATLRLSSVTAQNEVEFQNPIALGGSRTIQVDDNPNIATDFAHLSGVLSDGTAASSFVKAGGGILSLSGANTYTGTTRVDAGSIIVRSFGNSASPGATSIGDSTSANTDARALELGNGGTGAGIVQYIGAGETSDRKIRLNTTTGTTQIHADGSGPLILTNVANDSVDGVKNLTLRGTNAAGNRITSILANGTAGSALSLTVDGSATWILTGANTYTGATAINAGALGVGDNQALGIGGNISLNSGNMFAYGDDRTLANPVTLVNNTTMGFMGDYSLTFSTALTNAAAANNVGINNSIVAGKSLTLTGMTANAMTANRTLTVDGPGTTIINGDISTTTVFGVPIAKTGNGVLELRGNSAANIFTQGNAGIDIDRGILRIGANEVIPHTGTSATYGGVTFSPENAGAEVDTATLDLNGFNETITVLSMNTAGTATIDNTSTNAASLTFGQNNAALTFGAQGPRNILNSGGGALSITKAGTTAASIPLGYNLSYSGTTTVSNGSLAIASAVNGSTSLTVNNNVSGPTSLALTGGITSSAVTSVVVENNATLSLLDGAGNRMQNLTNLTLGSTGGANTTLSLNAGDISVAGDNLNTDLLSLASGTLNLFTGNTITFNINDAGLNPNQQYILLDASGIGGGFFGGASPHASIAAYLLGSLPGGFTSFDLATNSTTNQIILSTGNLITGASYWTGLTSNTWNGSSANWADDKAGTIPALSIPGQGTDVVFTADNISGGTVATTLEQNFKIASLTFEAGTATPNLVTIAPGAVATNRLEIATQSSTAGIAITTGGPATASISAPVRLTGDQTWNVADAASNLRISGALQGGTNLDLEKIGAGKVTLGAAADTLFNTGGTAAANVTISNGTLEILNVGALGTVANANLANIIINSTGVFYSSAATGTVANPITLNGSTISAGAAAQIYSGAITANSTAGSTINMVDQNGSVPATTTVARNITLAGVVSGAGKLIVDSVPALSQNNPLTGTLTLRGANSGWSGGLDITRGTVTATDVNALGTGNINAANGRIILNAGNGATFSLAQNIDLNSSGTGILEIQADNSAGTPTLDMTGNLSGVITLTGTGSTAALRLVNAADNFSVLNLTNSVVLANEGSISVLGPRTTTISGVISETGGPRALFVNDDRGAWAQTNTTLRLTGLNTFSGDVTVAEGVLEYDTVTNIAGAPSALGQGSAINMIAATLRFIGSASQTTNRPINQTGASIYSANGTGGASIDYQGLLTAANGTAGQNITLTGATGSDGILSGGFVQPDVAADVAVTGATWTITGSSTVADDLTVQNNGTILNVNTADALNFGGGANVFTINNGGTVNINASQTAASTFFDNLNVGQSGTGAGTLNIASGSSVTATATLDLGERAAGLTGTITGNGGTLTVRDGDIDLFRGSISADLATSTSAGDVQKFGPGTVTLSGNNTGLISTASTVINEGTLELLYTTDNNTKVRAASALDMRGGTIIINGNNAAPTSQSVAGLILSSGGNNTIDVNGGTGQDAVLNLGTITRAGSSGTARFDLPTGTQSATNGVTTTSPNSIYGLLGTGTAAANVSAYATVTDGTGTHFATNVGGNVVAVTEAVKDSVATWSVGDHITDSVGFTGSLDCIHINSLRFNAATGSDLSVLNGGVLSIGSGGILVTSNVGGTPTILGGTLTSGTGEVLITQDSAQPFEISSDIRAALAITKSGTGILELSGNNTGTGQVTIVQGTLQVSGGSAIGDLSRVAIAVNQASTLQLLNSETIGRLAGGNATVGSLFGTVALGANTLTINQSGANETYAGVLTGTGGLVKQGTHNLALTGVSTGYTGPVTVNGGAGLLQLVGLGQLNASSFTINSGGALLIDNNGTTRSATRILDTTSITLNSAGGPTQGGNVPRGLWIRTDQNAQTSETIGALNFNSGANYLTGDATGTTGIAALNADNFTRSNNATVAARARAMGQAAGDRNLFRITTAGNETSFMAANLVGAGGTGTASRNLSIVPWAIGEQLGGNAGDTAMGNSLVSYVAGNGFRALDLANQYDTFGTSSATSNVRESLTANLLGVTAPTVNALVIHNDNASSAAATVNVAGAGSLAVTSGAMLFTLNSTAAANNVINTSVNTFTGISTGATNEYVITVQNPFATNPATNSVTIASPLTSTADITKSGRGTLILTGANTAGGATRRTTINEGTLEISALSNIGGATGPLVFAGGTLRLGAAIDITTRSISYLNGGGTIDTNGFSPTFAASVGSGTGGLTKAGAGTLTLNAAATYSGATTISAGTVAVGVNNAMGVGGSLTINGGTAVSIGANNISHGLVTLQGASPLITGTGTINASGGFVLTNTGNTQIDAVLAGAGGFAKSVASTGVTTLTGANTYTGTTEVQAGTLTFSTIGNVGGGATNLGAPTTTENGIIRTGLGGTGATLNYVGAGSTSNRIIAMQGTTGGLTITQANTAGAALNLGRIQTETPGAKLLTLNGASSAANSVAGIHEAASGALSVTKAGTGTWVINGANNYTGNTLVSGGGVLRAGNNQSFGTVGTVTIQDTNTVLELANAVNIARPLTVSNTGNAKTLRLLSGASTGTYSGPVSIAETTAGNFIVNVDTGGSLTSSGVISSTGATALAGITKTGPGTLVVTGANTYRGVTAINDGIVNIQNNDALGNNLEGTTVASGATLQLEGGSLIIVGEALTLNGTGETGQNGALVNVIGSNAYGGNITLGSNSTISTDDGNLNITGNVSLGANTLTSTGDNGGQTVIFGDISGTGGLTVSAVSAAGHTLTLDPNTINSFTGATAINADATLVTQDAGALGGTTTVSINSGGTLLLAGTGDRINDAAAFTMTDGTFNTAGLSETVGALTLSATNSIAILDLAGLNLNNVMAFGDSSANGWTGQLHIWNWSGITLAGGGGNGGAELDQVFFGLNNSALTAGQLSQITFFSDGGVTSMGPTTFGLNGQIVPVPEPTGVGIGLALFGLAGWRERRRSAARRREERNANRI